jgi:hypothetical protein
MNNILFYPKINPIFHNIFTSLVWLVEDIAENKGKIANCILWCSPRNPDYHFEFLTNFDRDEFVECLKELINFLVNPKFGENSEIDYSENKPKKELIFDLTIKTTIVKINTDLRIENYAHKTNFDLKKLHNHFLDIVEKTVFVM